MRLREVIEVLNQMRADGVVDRYAVGGAVGATFYLEPVSTLDVDVFIELHAQSTSFLVDLSSIHEYLENRGGAREHEYIVYADTPIQFLLPEADSLTSEALAEAVEKDIDGLPVLVFTAEHLAAIALQTNRSKDKTRLVQFIDEGALDMDRFKEILKHHNLIERWEQFERTILSGEA